MELIIRRPKRTEHKSMARLYSDNIKKVLYYIKLSKKKGKSYVAVINKEIVGMLVCNESNMNPRIIEGSYLAVKKEHRRKKIATSLLTKFLDDAKKKYSSVLIYTRFSNPARRLYKKLGFSEVARDDRAVYLFKRLK